MWGLDTAYYFYLLLLIPLLIAVYLWNTMWKKKKIAEFGSGNYLKRLAPEASTTSKPFIKMVLLAATVFALRSEEHTSELQSRPHLVCRLLLEKKKKNIL